MVTTAPEDPSSAPATLAVAGAGRRFGTVPALDEVDLRVEQGEILALLGPSGCGKTTLLRSVAGLERLDRGRVEVGGRDVTGWAPEDRGVAMVFQDAGLFPHVRVRTNIALPLRAARRAKRAYAEGVVETISATLRIGHLLDRYPHELSGGERQRVGIARALVVRPALLLMDEPFAAIDADLRLELRREIRRLHRAADLADTLFVTHDQTEALAIADRVAVMFSGRIEQVDTPARLLAQPATVRVARFLGVPRINLLPEAKGQIIAVRPSDLRLDGGPFATTGRVVDSEPFAGGWLATLRTTSGIELEVLVDREPVPDSALRCGCAPEALHRFDAESGARRPADLSAARDLWRALDLDGGPE